jgi:aldose 1-epimerase
MNRLCLIFSFLLLVAACSPKSENQMDDKSASFTRLSQTEFGTMPETGEKVMLYSLRNRNGMEMSVMNYGGIIVSVRVPDKSGRVEEVTLGYDSLEAYIRNNPYFGAIIGRYGNRISNGSFTLEGRKYTLPANDGTNQLHGGPKGFDKVYWNIAVADDSSSLKLTYHSPHGEQGYPGNLSAEVQYALTDDNEIRIDYKAATDKATVVNLTNHTYFNLTGDPSRNTILDHTLQISADSFLPVDQRLIPTGKLQPVSGTPFDFNTPAVIGQRIEDDNEQLKMGGGYDHCWVIRNHDGSLRQVATLTESRSGRKMDVLTTEPGIQFYSGNFLNASVVARHGPCGKRAALCLETQHFPDSPNKPSFPSVVLKPGETYTSTTVYKFSVVE